MASEEVGRSGSGRKGVDRRSFLRMAGSAVAAELLGSTSAVAGWFWSEDNVPNADAVVALIGSSNKPNDVVEQLFSEFIEVPEAAIKAEATKTRVAMSQDGFRLTAVQSALLQELLAKSELATTDAPDEIGHVRVSRSLLKSYLQQGMVVAMEPSARDTFIKLYKEVQNEATRLRQLLARMIAARRLLEKR